MPMELRAALEAYLKAPSGSAQEALARNLLEEVIARLGLSDRDVFDLLYTSDLGSLITSASNFDDSDSTDSDESDQIGTSEPLASNLVTFKFVTPSTSVTAGEIWSLLGLITNQSDFPVWIVDKYTTLMLPPTLYGSNSRVGSMGAYFPTIDSRIRRAHDIVRLDPGDSYSVLWSIDPISFSTGLKRDEDDSDASGILSKMVISVSSLFARVFNAWSEYLFFVPGDYTVSATMHVWSTPPVRPSQHVLNVGSSSTLTDHLTIAVGPSPWVLIFGACIGGTLAFALQTLSRLRDGNIPGLGGLLRAAVLGFSTAILLTSVVTILLSRMSATDFIISVDVQDIWGAVTTGFVVQWLGFGYLQRLFVAEASTAPTN